MCNMVISSGNKQASSTQGAGFFKNIYHENEKTKKVKNWYWQGKKKKKKETDVKTLAKRHYLGKSVLAERHWLCFRSALGQVPGYLLTVALGHLAY